MCCFFFGPNPNGIYISQVLLLFFLIRYSWSTYKSIIHTLFCIIDASPKQANAPEGSNSNAVRQGEMAYICHPNIAWQRLLETRLDDLWTHPRQLISHPHRLMCRANLCAMLTYVPHWKPSQHNFERPFLWLLPCTKVGPISLSKPRQSNLKSHNVQKCIFCTKYSGSTNKSK